MNHAAQFGNGYAFFVPLVRADKAEQLRQRQNKRLCVFNAIHIAQGSLNVGCARQIQRKARTNFHAQGIG